MSNSDVKDEAGDRAMLIEQIVDGTTPMSKWLASVDYSTYAGFEDYLKAQLRDVMNLKANLDKDRGKDAEAEALASFVDGRSAALQEALYTFRVVRELEKASS